MTKNLSLSTIFIAIILVSGCSTVPDRIATPNSKSPAYSAVNYSSISSLKGCVKSYNIPDKHQNSKSYKHIIQWYDTLSQIDQCNVSAFRRHASGTKKEQLFQAISDIEVSSKWTCGQAKRDLKLTVENTVSELIVWEKDSEKICPISGFRREIEDQHADFMKEAQRLRDVLIELKKND